jgi:NodT family efflux transporter outer membrane factor (OMF) lipoprotein
MGNKFNLIKIIFLVIVTVLLFAGCSAQTTKNKLPMDAPKSFSKEGIREVPEKWWKVFENTRLNALVDSALESNFNLKTAWERLKAAQAVVDRSSASLYPDLDASAQGEITRPESQFQENETISLGLTSEYEIDLWGRISSIVEAREFRARATYEDYQAAALSLSAEIVRTWFQLMEARSQLKLVNKQINTNEKVLSLIKARFGSGLVRSVDILRQEQLLESTREQKISVESRIKVLENQLSVLLGRTPQKGVEYSFSSLPELPPLPKTGLPVDLVRRRPDVKSAYNSVKAADQELAAAISNQYPRLSLTASISSTTAADNIDNLFEDWVRSFAGNLFAPIFYGGELSAEVDRTKAVKNQRLYEYGQTVLTAFREVEDALVREKKQRERIESLKQQVELAQQSYEQLRLEYFNGVGDYLDVLTALDEEQQLRRNLISSRLTLIEYRISLYRSLAGSFETKRETQK